jgi:hypothetical protein
MLAERIHKGQLRGQGFITMIIGPVYAHDDTVACRRHDLKHGVLPVFYESDICRAEAPFTECANTEILEMLSLSVRTHLIKCGRFIRD